MSEHAVWGEELGYKSIPIGHIVLVLCALHNRVSIYKSASSITTSRKAYREAAKAFSKLHQLQQTPSLHPFPHLLLLHHGRRHQLLGGHLGLVRGLSLLGLGLSRRHLVRVSGCRGGCLGRCLLARGSWCACLRGLLGGLL